MHANHYSHHCSIIKNVLHVVLKITAEKRIIENGKVNKSSRSKKNLCLSTLPGLSGFSSNRWLLRKKKPRVNEKDGRPATITWGGPPPTRNVNGQTPSSNYPKGRTVRRVYAQFAGLLCDRGVKTYGRRHHLCEKFSSKNARASNVENMFPKTVSERTFVGRTQKKKKKTGQVRSLIWTIHTTVCPNSSRTKLKKPLSG